MRVSDGLSFAQMKLRTRLGRSIARSPGACTWTGACWSLVLTSDHPSVRSLVNCAPGGSSYESDRNDVIAFELKVGQTSYLLCRTRPLVVFDLICFVYLHPLKTGLARRLQPEGSPPACRNSCSITLVGQTRLKETDLTGHGCDLERSRRTEKRARADVAADSDRATSSMDDGTGIGAAEELQRGEVAEAHDSSEAVLESAREDGGAEETGQELVAVVFGGGEHPTSYYNDVHLLVIGRARWNSPTSPLLTIDSLSIPADVSQRRRGGYDNALVMLVRWPQLSLVSLITRHGVTSPFWSSACFLVASLLRFHIQLEASAPP
jgi:hypothetical protein